MNEEYKSLIDAEIPQDDSTSDEEKFILMDLIRKHKPKTIVEIGTHRGKTTVYMGVAAKEVEAHIHTYDPHEWGAKGNFRKFPDLPITYYQQPALQSDVTDIDFLFCDGFHEKHHVLNEIEHFFPRLTKDAVVVFHDTNDKNIPYCDVIGAIDEKKLKVEYLKTLNGMAVYENGNRNGKRKVRNTKSRKATK